jgi:hypothetical protein
MVLPVVALVFAVPQLAGYVVARLWRGAGTTEWLGTVVAAYTAIWYPIFGRALSMPAGRCGIGPMIAWVTLVFGLLFQLVIAGVIATAYFERRRAPTPPPPPAPPTP